MCRVRESGIRRERTGGVGCEPDVTGDSRRAGPPSTWEVVCRRMDGGALMM